jgi:hypothetical protein
LPSKSYVKLSTGLLVAVYRFNAFRVDVVVSPPDGGHDSAPHAFIAVRLPIQS